MISDVRFATARNVVFIQYNERNNCEAIIHFKYDLMHVLLYVKFYKEIKQSKDAFKIYFPITFRNKGFVHYAIYIILITWYKTYIEYSTCLTYSTTHFIENSLYISYLL